VQLHRPPVRGQLRGEYPDLPGSKGEQRDGVDPAGQANADAEREALQRQARGRGVALEGERGGREARESGRGGEGVSAEMDRGGGGGRVRGEEDQVGGREEEREAGGGGERGGDRPPDH